MSPTKDKDNPLGLKAFEGHAVVGVGMDVSNVGGGLGRTLDLDEKQALKVSEYTIGDSFYVTLRLDVKDVDFRTNKDGDVRRVPVTRCTDATIMDSSAAEREITAQIKRNVAEMERRQRAAEEEQGIQRLVETAADGGAVDTSKTVSVKD